MNKTYFLLIWITLLIGCSAKESSNEERAPLYMSPYTSDQKANFSQVNPTEKYKGGSIWRVEYGDTVLNAPMDFISDRGSSTGFFDMYILYPEMEPHRRKFSERSVVRLMFQPFNTRYSESTMETMEYKLNKGYAVKIGLSTEYPELMEYQWAQGGYQEYFSQSPEFLNPQDRPYRFFCRVPTDNPQPTLARAVLQEQCGLRVDYGDGLTMQVSFNRKFLTNWKQLISDINNLVESFKEK